jgi:hypothetical protein
MTKNYFRLVASLIFAVCIFSCSVGSQLLYSTYLGGSNVDEGDAIALDTAGNVYITGRAYSVDFPVTTNAYSTTLQGFYNVFVSKINPNLSGVSSLVYSTYLGGLSSDYGYGITVDNAGNIYITGVTESTDFPVTSNAFSTTLQGTDNVFVSKINPNLSGVSSLVYSTYLGGTSHDFGQGIAVDTAGNAYITGYTRSADFPITTNAFQTTNRNIANGNAFISKINTNSSGTASLVYSSYLGGSGSGNGWDEGTGIAIDSAGNGYITGYTASSDFPVTSNALSTTRLGYANAFLSKIDPNLTGVSSLVYSTYLGGNNGDLSYGIAVDTAGNAYITGYTDSTDFPVTTNAFSTTLRGNENAFVSKINPNLSGISSLLYSTYLGGNYFYDEAYGLALDSAGNAYITGYTECTDFPVTSNAFQTTNGDTTNGTAFISKINTNSSGTASLVYSSYLGGSGSGGGGDVGNGIAVDNAGNAYITGYTYSPNFPVTSNAFQTTMPSMTQGGWNAFVTKLNTLPPPPSLQGTVIYSNINNNGIVSEGDTLTLQFNEEMQVNGADASDFVLPVTGDSLGTGATVSINTVNDTQIIITLGTSPFLTISGTFNIMDTTAGSPSGIDISSTLPPGVIQSIYGVNAQGGTPQDILYNIISISTTVSAFSAFTVQASQDSTDSYYTEDALIIPQGSLSVPATITIGPPGNNHGQLSAVLYTLTTSGNGPGGLFETPLGSPSLTFSAATPARVVIQFKTADTQQEAGYLPNSMRIFQWDTGSQSYQIVPQTYGAQSVNTMTQTVTVPVTSFDVFSQGIVQPFANIALPTVDSQSYNVGPSPQTILHPFTNNLVLTVGTSGIYTLHQLTIPYYQLTVSSFTISLEQATLADKNGWQNNAVLDIIANSNPTTQPILTMQYMNQNDPNGQYTDDVIGGPEYLMRIYRWINSSESWQEIPGTQTVNLTNHTVTVTIPDALTTAQIYAVGVDTVATNSSTTDVRIPWELFDQEEYMPSTSNSSFLNNFDMDKPENWIREK